MKPLSKHGARDAYSLFIRVFNLLGAHFLNVCLFQMSVIV